MSNADRDYTRYPEKNTGCSVCKAKNRCADAYMNHAIHCGSYGIYDTDMRSDEEE